MEVEIWCTRSLRNRTECKVPNPEGFCLWKGNMECIPRKGDMITVFDGWGSEEVQRVWWDIEKQEVEIDIHPDWTGEYKKHVETLKENKEGEQ